ncbi:hypothetical protein IFM89_004293 [Coptis chinensis]|uniref:Cyclin-like domain-containing protein n=1 Tax=Coptis chinensis TaxID=261450 RepID=A0A835M1G4_9MAGN|nr:hypothetical protein IFM89_004293 [Coptis chinensis]
MNYTAIDTFYMTDEQLKNSPSRKDGIDESTETTLRIYGCVLIQESGILVKLIQSVMATAQVLFHRFYCKKSFARFNVKRVAATCIWLASKLEETPRKARHVILVFNRMECRRGNLPIEHHFDNRSDNYKNLKVDLIEKERHLLKEMGFICHVEHPHKFISNYIATLETPPDLRQEAWNLANDSLRTTLCVRFRSEVVACGVVLQLHADSKSPCLRIPPGGRPLMREGTVNDETVHNELALDRLNDDTKSLPIDGEAREDAALKSKAYHKTEATAEKNKEKERKRERETEKLKVRDRDQIGGGTMTGKVIERWRKGT